MFDKACLKFFQTFVIQKIKRKHYQHIYIYSELVTYTNCRLQLAMITNRDLLWRLMLLTALCQETRY